MGAKMPMLGEEFGVGQTLRVDLAVESQWQRLGAKVVGGAVSLSFSSFSSYRKNLQRVQTVPIFGECPVSFNDTVNSRTY
jgi:hypothetical protein